MDKKYTQLEIARIIGEPKDPRKPYPDLVEAICQTDTADPEEYLYYFDVLEDTDKIYTTVANGVTQQAVSLDTPASVTWVDIATPEYYVKITDLAQKKERVIARKLNTINRALNAEENYRVIQVLDSAATGEGNTFDLTSGSNSFTYQNCVDLIDAIVDYGDNFVLVAGTQIDKDIKLWDWTSNKYTSLAAAFKDLNVKVIRIFGSLTRDGNSTSILASTTAYMVANNTNVGKPNLFVRKRLDDISILGGVISDEGEKPERLVFSSPNPITVTGSARYLAVGIIGFEEIVVVNLNPKAIARFTRD